MKVSVIIPVYNVESYIEECLRSVQEQTLPDIEIICIDDKGSDNSIQIIEKLAEKDKRISIYTNDKNRGLAYSRNVGLLNAKGEYVYFLDSDDMIEPEALESLYQIAKKDELDAITFCARFVYENKDLEEKFSTNPARFKGEYPDILEGKTLFVQWMKIWDWMPSQPRFFYNRRFLETNNIRFINGMLHEDEIFAFDVLMNAKRMRVLSHPYFIRRFRNNSIMTGMTTWKNIEGCIRILQHVTMSSLQYKQQKDLSDAICYYKKKIAANLKNKIKSMEQDVKNVDSRRPMISVIIPVYNVAPYIEECLDSVLSQPFIDIEIICVNDGSMDDSFEIVKEYQTMDPRIICIENEKNCGQSVARNKGLNVAKGKYIYMLDADDKIKPEIFRVLIPLCESEELDVIAFENIQFADSPEYECRAKECLFTYHDVEGKYSGTDAFITCVEKDVISPSVPTFLFRREFLNRERIRFVENIQHEDIGFILEVLLKANNIRLMHKQFLCRRFRAHSTVTSGFASKQMEGYLKSWQKYFDCYDEVMNRNAENQGLIHALNKWKRDVLGRIRMLYVESEEHPYCLEGGYVDETTRRLLEVLKETTSTRDRTYEILGKDFCDMLEAEEKVYICGTGQYAHRVIELVAALDVEIKGILCEETNRKTFCGFPFYTPDKLHDKKSLMLLAFSHYQNDKYKKMLSDNGFDNCISVRF